MTVILVTRDLAVISQVDGAAARIGAIARTVSNEADAAQQCVEERAELIVIDLGMPSLNVNSLVEQVKAATATPPRFVAFGPHVHAELLAAAREAGCDSVISRGQFFAQLNAAISGQL
jgi:DNA-binding NarL/FixJ family response regulator